MGASGWKYFVPYQADIGKAFMELRDEVFARGDYEFFHVRPPEDVIEVFTAFNVELLRFFRGEGT